MIKAPYLPLLFSVLGMLAFLNNNYGEDGFSEQLLRKNIVNSAKEYLGVKYHYGGTNTRGFDCSGFVKSVYKQNGIILPRTTGSQFIKGRKIKLKNAKHGDLVFFRIYKRKISHVGIYLGKSKFIHAPSKGKKVSISDMNISYWKKRFAGAVTYLFIIE